MSKLSLLSIIVALCVCAVLLLDTVHAAPSPQSSDARAVATDLSVGAEEPNAKDEESDLEGASSLGYGYYAYPSYVGGIYGGYGGYGGYGAHYPYYSSYYGLAGYPYYSGYYGGYHGLHGHYF